MDFAVQREQQPQRVFGDGVGGVLGDADDGDAEVAGRLHVDVVVAGAAHGDESDAVGVESGHHVGVEVVIDEGADSVEALAEASGAGLQLLLEEGQGESVRGVGGLEELAVVGLGIEDGELEDGWTAVAHGSPPCVCLACMGELTARKNVPCG